MFTQILIIANVVTPSNSIVMVCLFPFSNGASHKCTSSCVLFTPSNKFVTTLGSLRHSGKTFTSDGDATI